MKLSISPLVEEVGFVDA